MLYKTHYDNLRILKETNLILDSIGDAVITHTDLGITFFNKAGRKILFFCINQLNENERDEVMNEIVSIDLMKEKKIEEISEERIKL